MERREREMRDETAEAGRPLHDVQGLFLCLLDLAVKLLVGCFAVLLFAAALVAGLDFDVQVLVNDFRALHDVRRWRALFLLNRRVGVVL